LTAQFQFNVEYVPLEDRLRLRIRMGEAEFLLWLTRRYTGLLLGVLEKVGDAPQTTDGTERTRQAVNAFQRDAALDGADFKTAYRETATEHPLGEEPILAARISYATAENGSVKLTLGPEAGQSITINMGRDMAFILIRMLQQAALKAQWALGAAGDSSGIIHEGAEAPVVH
jgi:hypothetical protein